MKRNRLFRRLSQQAPWRTTTHPLDGAPLTDLAVALLFPSPSSLSFLRLLPHCPSFPSPSLEQLRLQRLRYAVCQLLRRRNVLHRDLAVAHGLLYVLVTHINVFCPPVPVVLLRQRNSLLVIDQNRHCLRFLLLLSK